MPVILVDGNLIKVACYSCIKGHRSKTCKHWNRVLVELRKPGRPQSGCQHAKLDLESDCKCRQQSAYYLPGHQPRFANTESSGVIVNAVEHPQLAANLAEGGGVKVKGRSRTASLQTPPELDMVAGETPPPVDVKHCGCCQHSNQHDSGTESPKNSTPAPPKTYCENHSELCFAPRTIASQPTIHNHAIVQENLSKAIGLPIDPSSPAKKSSCCSGSSAQTSTSPLNYFKSSHLSSQPFATTTLTPAKKSSCCSSSSNPNTSTPLHQFLPSQLSSDSFSTNSSPATIDSAAQNIPQYYNANVSPQWDVFPVVNAINPNTVDGCSCIDEPSCLCEGCRDHPRNPATMQMVQDALDYQAQATYFDFGDNVGDQLELENFAPPEIYGDPLVDMTHQYPEPLQHSDFGLQGQRYDQMLAGNFMSPPSLPATPPMYMQHQPNLQYPFSSQGSFQHVEKSTEQYPEPFDEVPGNPPIKPTMWSQTRAKLNPGLLYEQTSNFQPESAKS